MRLILNICCLMLAFSMGLIAQEGPAPTPGDIRLKAVETRKALREASIAAHLPFTSIGPAIFSGRIVDVEVNPSKPTEMYIAYASGGLWYTDNNGTTMTPVFDQEAAMTIGDIAVHWSAGIIWVGTGENNSSRSSYSGVGIYKSTDKGKTWKHMGLPESHHIGRIVLHPVNPNIVHVGVLGALYSENTNRGVYTTPDGGVTWRQSLYINPNTGVIDLMTDPSNPNTLYAATWERTRRAWNFTESGEGTGIYKSGDGGRTWELLSGPDSGLPHGQGAGRIGLDMVKTKNGNWLYAVIDNQDTRPAKDPEPGVLTKAQLAEMSADTFLALKEETLKKFLDDNGFPEKYSAEKVKSMVKKGTITPRTLVDYLQDANSKLFDTEVTGAEVYKSMDGGRTWHKTHAGYLDAVFHTYGYYFGQIRVAKNNPDKLYILGVPLLRSDDGGATWQSIGGDNVHGDHHALWVNPRLEGHLVLGNDGGLNISYDDGAHWIKCNQPAVGQFYSVSVDMAEPYNVYGGLQDNGVWVGPSTHVENVEWHSSGQYPFKEIMGGDGMQTAIDTRDNNTVYTGFQFGNYYKVARNGSFRSERITPQHELGEYPYRWNWETPVHLSIHNQDILYMAGNKVFRSMQQGKNFKPISGDLTRGGREGDVAYGTIVSLHESPMEFGLIYAGSDDGLIHVTRDGGAAWKKISDGLPQWMWVSSLQASAHEKGRVYAALNGYRWDHFESYVYASDDYGDTWTRICTGLPAEPVNVVKEDPVNADILYIGTDHGLYTSINRGQTVMVLGDLPATPVHDLVIHPRDQEIVVGTHGRSFYKANVEHLQMVKADMDKTLTSFDEKRSVFYRDNWGSRYADWAKYNEPKVSFPVYTAHAGSAKLQIYADSLLVADQIIDLKKGLSYYDYNLEISPEAAGSLEAWANEKNPKRKVVVKKADNGKYYLAPGKYTLTIRSGQEKADCALDIKTRD